MRIARIINNNTVLAWDNDKKHVVIIGKGIGFQKKQGDLVTLSRIEQKFTLEQNVLI